MKILTIFKIALLILVLAFFILLIIIKEEYGFFLIFLYVGVVGYCLWQEDHPSGKKKTQEFNMFRQNFSCLTTDQKLAIMNFMCMFGLTNDGSEKQKNQISKLVSMMGSLLQVEQDQVNAAIPRFDTFDKIICELKTIKNKAILESVFLACLDVVRVTNSEMGHNALFDIYMELGYSVEELTGVILKSIEFQKKFQ